MCIINHSLLCNQRYLSHQSQTIVEICHETCIDSILHAQHMPQAHRGEVDLSECHISSSFCKANVSRSKTLKTSIAGVGRKVCYLNCFLGDPSWWARRVFVFDKKMGFGAQIHVLSKVSFNVPCSMLSIWLKAGGPFKKLCTADNWSSLPFVSEAY